MSEITHISTPVDCLNIKNSHLEIKSPIPSFGTTIFGVYLIPIIVIFGVAGNIISLIILNQAAKKISSHLYLWWLAVFDIISLLSYMPTFWAAILMRPYYHYVYGPQYPATWVEYGLLGKYICQIRMFVTFTARTCSIYTIVLVTVERFMMVVFPMLRTKLCTIFVAKLSILIMVIITIFVNFPWFFTFDVVSKPCFPLGVCVGNTILLINKMVEFIILCLIPSMIIVICNGCIIYTIKSRLRFDLLVVTDITKKQERDITIRLLAVSFSFFFLTIPSLVVVSIQTVQELKQNFVFLRGSEADAFVLSIVLFAINLAINFIIYCLTGKNFRTAALALLKCDWKNVKRYRGYLVTDSTTVVANDTKDMKLCTDEFQTGMSIRSSSSFQNRSLLNSNV